MVEDWVPFGECRKTQKFADALRLNPEPRLDRRSKWDWRLCALQRRNWLNCMLLHN